MRILAQDRAFYRKIRVGGNDHPETRRRFDLLTRVECARRAHGMTAATVRSRIGESAGAWWTRWGCSPSAGRCTGAARCASTSSTTVGTLEPAEHRRRRADCAMAARDWAHQVLRLLVRGPRQGRSIKTPAAKPSKSPIYSYVSAQSRSAWHPQTPIPLSTDGAKEFPSTHLLGEFWEIGIFPESFRMVRHPTLLKEKSSGGQGEGKNPARSARPLVQCAA